MLYHPTLRQTDRQTGRQADRQTGKVCPFLFARNRHIVFAGIVS